MKIKLAAFTALSVLALNFLSIKNVYAQLGEDTCSSTEISTAIGCVDLSNSTNLTQFFLRWFMGIGGGIALILIVLASYRIMTSQGDPRRLQGGQELFMSALGGLILLVFSVFLLRIVGVDILGIFS